MQLGVVGLGRMGGNIARRLMRNGHECVVFDRDAKAVAAIAADGAVAASDHADLIGKLKPPRAVWLMLPAGGITEHAVLETADLLEPGDAVIDGGNTFWKDDIRRGAVLKQRGLHYLDVGTSGGVWGAERGYCLMIGGDDDVVKRLEPIFETLAPGTGDIPKTPDRENYNQQAEKGFLHCGPVGAGHFVKMVHNGIEYGLMQAYAEGFDILRNADKEELPAEHRMKLPLADIAEVWRRGSVVSSWLLDLSAIALAQDPQLDGYSGYVEDSGEGRWTLLAAIEEAVPAAVLSAALYARFRSRQDHTFSDRLLSAMRKQFGGHVEPGADKFISAVMQQRGSQGSSGA